MQKTSDLAENAELNNNLEIIMEDLNTITKIQEDIQSILENDKHKLSKIQNIQQNIDSLEEQSLENIKDAKQYSINYQKIILAGIAGLIIFSPIGGMLPLVFL
jgi:chromosome segregation ATPase